MPNKLLIALVLLGILSACSRTGPVVIRETRIPCPQVLAPAHDLETPKDLQELKDNYEIVQLENKYLRNSHGACVEVLGTNNKEK